MSIKQRGFGGMDPEKHRAIASMGGRAAHANGKGHQFTTAEASAAGRKGGLMSAIRREARRAADKAMRG